MISPPSFNSELSARVREHPLIAVLRAEEAALYRDVIDVLVNNGIDSIERTLSTPGTLEKLPALLGQRPMAASSGSGRSFK
ncbi:MAG: 2-dehydro-3-deoxyphosphogluconate aldolase [Microbacteriaceae bacterium]|nr:2-dehydro-3-deoxyphosphogluconate aldolase [Microbacteriaceae bacterium]